MLVQMCQRALTMVFAFAGCFTCCGVFGSDVLEDLRIETTVQVGSEGATSNNLTLFTSAGVYDYVSDTPESHRNHFLQSEFGYRYNPGPKSKATTYTKNPAIG